jgi:hypothetical protein
MPKLNAFPMYRVIVVLLSATRAEGASVKDVFGHCFIFFAGSGFVVVVQVVN